MENLYILILSLLFSAIVAMVGYWLKSVHKEFKGLIKELAYSISELRQLFTGMETQIEKGIEADITEIKSDIKTLYAKSNRSETQIARLNQKTK